MSSSPSSSESGSPHPRAEVQAAVERYVTLRHAIDRGEAWWTDLADLFSADAIYVDPAWGRIQGREQIRAFFDESMRGLEDWSFPMECIAVEGDDVFMKWTQRLPGTRADGSHYEQSGYSRLIYGGDGLFRYEEDVLNMVHVLDDLKASGWRPGEGFVMPPSDPDRNFATS